MLSSSLGSRDFTERLVCGTGLCIGWVCGARGCQPGPIHHKHQEWLFSWCQTPLAVVPFLCCHCLTDFSVFCSRWFQGSLSSLCFPSDQTLKASFCEFRPPRAQRALQSPGLWVGRGSADPAALPRVRNAAHGRSAQCEGAGASPGGLFPRASPALGHSHFVWQRGGAHGALWWSSDILCIVRS